MTHNTTITILNNTYNNSNTYYTNKILTILSILTIFTMNAIQSY